MNLTGMENNTMIKITNTCPVCGKKEAMEFHESYIGPDLPKGEWIALCADCHVRLAKSPCPEERRFQVIDGCMNMDHMAIDEAREMIRDGESFLSL